MNTWDAFKNYEIGDGLGSMEDLKPNIKLPKLPRLPTADEVGNKVYNKVTGARKRAFFADDDWLSYRTVFISNWISAW